MTVGTVGSSSVASTSFTGVGFYRDWAGGDGKTETYAGVLRAKWNYLQSLTESRLRAQRICVVEFLDSGFPDVTTSSFNVGFDVLSPILTFTSNDQVRLESKLTSAIRNSDFNLAVNLSQMRQTVDMATSNLTKLGRSILALKRGDFSTAARQLGANPRGTRLKPTDISGRWLELQYGWLPLISDCYDSAKLFENISRGPRSKLIRVKIAKKSDCDGSLSPDKYSWSYQQRLYRYLEYQMYEEMSAVRQMGLLDPLSVIWENIPYSFVVDWFIPVGTYLDNLNVIPSLNGRFLTTTVRKCIGGGPPRAVDPAEVSGRPARFIVNAAVHNDSHRLTTINRVFSATLFPTLPSFNLAGAIHGKRFWNSLALASQRFLK